MQTTRLSGILLPAARRTSEISLGRLGISRSKIVPSDCVSLLMDREQQFPQRFAASSPSSSSFKLFSTSSSSQNQEDAVFDANVDYKSPLGELISRLKMVSITGCFLSVCVMPALVFLKNGDLPNAQQATMGGIATLGATGSTAALHFVFGAYVLDMNTIDSDGKKLLHATTRSVLGFKTNSHIFNPTTDVQPYEGNRPFANFCVHGQPLYVHPEKLDPVTHRWLLGKPPSSGESTDKARDSEGLTLEKKKKNDDDDELF